MTLLTIAQNVAVELNLRRPSAVIGSTDQDTRQILRAINVECDALREAAYWQRLRKERPFTGIAGTTQTGILPSDFDRMVPETFWNLSSTRLFSNVQDEVQWQGLVATSYVGPQPQFIIRGNELMVLPALSGGESLSFIYVSTEFVRAADNTPNADELANLVRLAKFLEQVKTALGGKPGQYLRSIEWTKSGNSYQGCLLLDGYDHMTDALGYAIEYLFPITSNLPKSQPKRFS